MVRCTVRYSALLAACLLAIPLAVAQPDPSCDGALERSEADYFEGHFDDAIDRLTSCLSAEAFTEEEGQVYTLLGKVYSAKGLENQARGAIRQLLIRVPNYRPNVNLERPSFVAFVEEVRRELEEEAAARGPEAAPADSMLVTKEPVPTDTTGEEPAVEEIREEPEEEVAARGPEAVPVDSMLVMKEPVPADTTGEDPTFEPPVDPEPQASSRGGLTKWLVIGGGATAAGVAVLLLTGGTTDDPDLLPLPPRVPNQ